MGTVLTVEQEKKLERIQDDWFKVTQQTGPGDREAIRKAIPRVYKASGKKIPVDTLFLRSPFACSAAYAILALGIPEGKFKTKGDKENNKRRRFLLSIAHKTAADLESQLQTPILEKFSEFAQYERNVDKLFERIQYANVRINYVQNDSLWLATYYFFNKELGLGETHPFLDHIWPICREAGWLLPCIPYALVGDRPTAVHQLSDGRFHEQNGPAIAYADGYGSFCILGVRLPPWIITDANSITVDDITQETNASIRQIMIHKMGLDRYITELKLKPVHKDRFGELYKTNLKAPDGRKVPVAMVKVINKTPSLDGTPEIYFIPVRADVKTAHEAVASTFNKTPEQYNPDFES